WVHPTEQPELLKKIPLKMVQTGSRVIFKVPLTKISKSRIHGCPKNKSSGKAVRQSGGAVCLTASVFQLAGTF
ncbi:hypothetical protein, partial [Desulfogranum mediterraneum]|uniref:hypothetical protein n=1 Tax=Desulfogranum mediterraneum TaxID=160661 RepID=UPI001ABF3E98